MLLASFLGGILLFFLGFFILIGLAASLGKEEVVVDNGSVLHLQLEGTVMDRPFEDPFQDLLGSDLSMIGLSDWIEAIDRAAGDDRITAIALEAGVFDGGYATLDDLKAALNRFRQSGKKVYMQSLVYTEKAIYLSSAVDSVLLHSSGFTEWNGIHATVTYLKNTLALAGIQPVVIRGKNNKFKSAVEPFLTDSMSANNREQLSAILSNLWSLLLEDVSSTRNVSADSLNRWASTLSIESAQDAVRCLLADAVVSTEEWHQFLQELTLAEPDEDPVLVGPSKYLKASSESGNYKDPRIAVVYAEGEMMLGSSSNGTMGADDIVESLRKARNDDRIKAVVLRVNSPGGLSIAGDMIAEQVALTKQKKPVVVSMGDYAASGGYMISALADSIFTHPGTLTGSIGVFGNFFTAEELLTKKLDLHFSRVKTHDYADLGAINRGITDAEYAFFQRAVDHTYGSFLAMVARGRGLDSLYVDSIGQGRVWSGNQAVKLGLADQLGGLHEAIEAAKQLAGLEGSVKLINYPTQKDPLEELLTKFTQSSEAKILKSELGPLYPYYSQWKRLQFDHGIFARMEGNISLN